MPLRGFGFTSWVREPRQSNATLESQRTKLGIALEPSEAGGYTACVPSLPGCISEGETAEEAMASVREPIDDDLACKIRPRGARARSVDAITSRRYTVIDMPRSQKRATVYFDPELHRALRLKAVETDRSLSELVNEAVKLTLAEDAEDLAAFEERASEPDLPFESVVKDLKRRGKI